MTMEKTEMETRVSPRRGAAKQPTTPRQRDDLYYNLIAGAAKTRLLESTFDLRLPHLLEERGPLTAAEIAEALGLHLQRAAKWLVLLERIGLLSRKDGRYQNTDAAVAVHWENGRENHFLRDLM